MVIEISDQLCGLADILSEHRQPAAKAEVSAGHDHHSLTDPGRKQKTSITAVFEFELSKFIPNSRSHRLKSAGRGDAPLEQSVDIFVPGVPAKSNYLRFTLNCSSGNRDF